MDQKEKVGGNNNINCMSDFLKLPFAQWHFINSMKMN